MAYIVFAHTVVTIGIALLLVLVPKEELFLLPFVVTDAYHWLCALFGFLLAIATVAIQIQDVKRFPRAKGISVWSSGLQILVLLALAIMLAFRPYSPYSNAEWGIFQDNWSLTVKYLVVISGHIFSLWVRFSCS